MGLLLWRLLNCSPLMREALLTHKSVSMITEPYSVFYTQYNVGEDLSYLSKFHVSSRLALFSLKNEADATTNSWHLNASEVCTTTNILLYTSAGALNLAAL